MSLDLASPHSDSFGRSRPVVHPGLHTLMHIARRILLTIPAGPNRPKALLLIQRELQISTQECMLHRSTGDSRLSR